MGLEVGNSIFAFKIDAHILSNGNILTRFKPNRTVQLESPNIKAVQALIHTLKNHSSVSNLSEIIQA